MRFRDLCKDLYDDLRQLIEFDPACKWRLLVRAALIAVLVVILFPALAKAIAISGLSVATLTLGALLVMHSRWWRPGPPAGSAVGTSSVSV
jgi:hypothetical protein